MYPAIHNLSPDLYTQIASNGSLGDYDSGWEVVNDNPIATQWSQEWTMKPDVIIEDPEKPKSAGKKSNDLKKLVGLLGHIQAPNLNKTNVSGNSGWLGYQKPYLTIINARPVGTEDLNKYIGLPLETKKQLLTLSGYTEVSEIFFPQNVYHTMSQDEINEIQALLNRGVVL